MGTVKTVKIDGESIFIFNKELNQIFKELIYDFLGQQK